MSNQPYRFKTGHDNPIRKAVHWWTHRRSGPDLICDAVILALAAIILDFATLFVSLVVDSYAIEQEPPALVAGLGGMLVRTMVVAAIVVGGIGFVRFAREGAETMNRAKRGGGSPALTKSDDQDPESADHRDAA
ncbi:MAG: hypothetical protein KDA20_04390 [Phycisphaerales bacterium]|nr:hypothetical protein [Phycisphaerales bacterium]